MLNQTHRTGIPRVRPLVDTYLPFRAMDPSKEQSRLCPPPPKKKYYRPVGVTANVRVTRGRWRVKVIPSVVFSLQILIFKFLFLISKSIGSGCLRINDSC